MPHTSGAGWRGAWLLEAALALFGTAGSGRHTAVPPHPAGDNLGTSWVLIHMDLLGWT